MTMVRMIYRKIFMFVHIYYTRKLLTVYVSYATESLDKVQLRRYEPRCAKIKNPGINRVYCRKMSIRRERIMSHAVAKRIVANVQNRMNGIERPTISVFQK
ncbi:hypothetical protein AU468_13525 [Alkalispirochaeta sphaeroplastigenens]|uniref:Uncharacterized protein n=1 Tax=Alkalispirochaeta sphaeroplastigenens TaxID=1187066 RepID=A0A2S4JG36_9SPIO|nr:hypothetical protein AU468_13525 [Alkalispirochaeta sphaeroplastigenens]